eukprot:scaffold263891_cov46-Prasinocladus_malaysianus.AAC.1
MSHSECLSAGLSPFKRSYQAGVVVHKAVSYVESAEVDSSRSRDPAYRASQSSAGDSEKKFAYVSCNVPRPTE